MAMTGEQQEQDSLQATAEYACQAYQLGRCGGIIRKLSGSYNRTVLMMTEHGRYVLRILNSAGQVAHLKEVQHQLIHLHQSAVPVPVPLSTLEGSCYALWEGSLIQVIPYIEGTSFDCREEQVLQSGAMLRRFHDVLQNHVYEVESKPTRSFYQSNDYYVQSLSRMKMNTCLPKHQVDEVELFISRMLEKWCRFEHKLPLTLIHGDWHLWNQIYRPSDLAASDRVVGVLDFDYMQRGYRIYDVAYTLWSIYVLLHKYADAFDSRLLTGYGCLSAEEKQVLPAAIARVSLFFLIHASLADQNSQKWESQIKRQLPLLRWLQRDGQERLEKLAHEHV